MNIKIASGIVLIALGVIALAWKGISYTRKEEVLKIGPVRATTTTRETIPIPPVVGGLCLAGGIVLLIMGRRKNG